jgi:hypothetical protein
LRLQCDPLGRSPHCGLGDHPLLYLMKLISETRRRSTHSKVAVILLSASFLTGCSSTEQGAGYGGAGGAVIGGVLGGGTGALIGGAAGAAVGAGVGAAKDNADAKKYR